MKQYILITNFKDTGQIYQQLYFDDISNAKELINKWARQTGNLEHYMYKKIDVEKDKP